MRGHSISFSVIGLLAGGPIAAQMVTTERLRALALDSVPGSVMVYYSPGISPTEAAELQQLMQNCVTRYRDSIKTIPSVTVGVLDSAAWIRVTPAPYGIPHHNFSVAPVPIVVPVTAAAIVGNVVPPERANRFFRLLALHELGHVLTFATVGVDPRDLGMPPRFPIPGWYNEFAADYFRLSCLQPSDRDAGISPEWLRANLPLYPLLDDGSRLHEKTTPDGKPYMGTPAYFMNGSWTMGVIAESAKLQLQHLGDGFLALLREQWHRPSGSASTEAIINDLKQSNPGLEPWLKSLGAIPDSSTALRNLIARAPRLPLQPTELKALPPREDWQLGMVSWIAANPSGSIFLLQRGDKADPVVVLDRDGKVRNSWGSGMYTMPHAIRTDPQGNIWTADAASSVIYKFSPQGQKLLEIAVGGQPVPCIDQQVLSRTAPPAPGRFCGTTDLAFAPNGHVFIADGYANDRILEYSADGRKLNEWGSAGTGPGQFQLPHSIRIDEKGIIYVADRENGRIQRFDLRGKYLGEWPNLGRIFSLELSGGFLWIATQPLDLPNFSPGWLLKLDRATGKVLGYVEVAGAHGMAVLDNGEVMVGPGPGRKPQWFTYIRSGRSP